MPTEPWTLDSAQAAVGALLEGTTDEVALAGAGEDDSPHARFVALSALAWWLMSVPDVDPKWRLRVPRAGDAAYRPLIRSGLMTAAQKRDIAVVDAEGRRIEGSALAEAIGQTRLPGVDWAQVPQEGDSQVPLARIVPDLTDPLRIPRRLHTMKLTYPWLGKLGLRSRELNGVAYATLLSDIDKVIRELVFNVHRWSKAADAFAVVSVTTGSVGESSWRRVHIVVADSGVGIPGALRRDIAALDAVHRAFDSGEPLEDLSDTDIVRTLLLKAFGGRRIPHHNGDGLHVAQHRSGVWAGRMDVLTTRVDGPAFRVATKGVNRIDTVEDLELHGARGTLVHLMLQAAVADDTRSAAADLEQLTLGEAPLVPAA